MADTRPPPAGPLDVTPMTWDQDRIIHRIHRTIYDGDQFNPGVDGNARFSPIRNAEGDPIPTIYGGDGFDCAAMETVFHDVAHTPGYKEMPKSRLADQAYSTLLLLQPLTLADLSSIALRALGIPRVELIDSEADQYPITRQWAEAIHAQRPDLQGLCWVSRQNDTARAVMLFGDRIERFRLVTGAEPLSLIDDPVTYANTLNLARRIGLTIVPGKTP